MADERGGAVCWPGLFGPGDARFVREGAACLIKGRTASARMDALKRRVADSIREGVAAGELLVACADPSSADRMRAALRGLGDVDAREVRVETVRELACSVIGQPSAARVTGVAFSSGRARILSAYETDFVVEDVKTLGTRPGRLRELLKFLYRGWTELSDEDPGWLFTVEEIDTMAFLTRELRYLGAVMEPQVANLATKVLRLNPALRDRFSARRAYVLDYQNMSLASQLLCQLVAGEDLVACADDAGCAEVHDSYPCLEGVGRFASLNPAALVIEKDEVEAGGPSRTEQVYGTPTDEIEAVARTIADEIAQGADPSSIAVTTPHSWWTRQVSHALASHDVPVNTWYGQLRLRGDVRELDRCLPLRAVTLLRLIADPRDGAAWRSWFGFGDYLARSNLFCAMRSSVECGGDVRHDLEAFGYDLGSDLDPLFVEVRDLRGPELLAYLVQTLGGPGTAIPAALRPLHALGSQADAAQMVAELDRLQFFAGIPAGDGVVVSPFPAMAGLDFARVHVVGFVNGLFPKAEYFDLTEVSINKQKKLGEADTRTAQMMARSAREALQVSSFRHVEHDFAERAGIKQARIFAASDDGGQVSEAERSIYTDMLLS